MDKESNNAIGRLGSQTHDESGSERMCSMPAEAGPDESGSREPKGSTEEILRNYAGITAVLGATLVGSFVVSFIIARMWNEDEIKLNALSFLTRVLQTIAFSTGKWALECERSYNEYVNALH
jgi:hypothetical protein